MGPIETLTPKTLCCIQELDAPPRHSLPAVLPSLCGGRGVAGVVQVHTCTRGQRETKTEDENQHLTQKQSDQVPEIVSTTWNSQ